MNWMIQAIIATLCSVVMVLLLSQLTYLKMNPTVINFYFFTFSAVGFASLRLVTQHDTWVLSRQAFVIFIVLGGVSVMGNYFAISAIAHAPNPGLVRIIQSLEAVFVTLAAIVLYKARIEPRQVLGILLMLLGLFMVSYTGR